MDKAAPAATKHAAHAVRSSGPAGGSRWSQLPYAIALAGTAGGLTWLGLAPRHAKVGMLAVACAVLLASAARLVLPERTAGMLVSRRRLTDVLLLASLGTSILVAALVLPASS